jgi:beta-N-acetylhexosaminidase
VGRLIAAAASLLVVGLAACGGGGTDHSTTTVRTASKTPIPKAKVIDLDPHSYPAPKRHRRGTRAAAPIDTSALAHPDIHSRPIPFGEKRKTEMAAYSQRHYGDATWRLTDPQVIVEHFTASTTFSSAYNTFANDRPDLELHELPGVCSHFVIDTDGTIYQLVKTTIRCRHTVGLNYTAIGIEHVGTSDAQVMGDRAQLAASLKLTNWLRCTYGIEVKNVIGHNESLSSPFHHEAVPALQSQTHGDMARATMTRYRGMLKQKSC